MQPTVRSCGWRLVWFLLVQVNLAGCTRDTAKAPFEPQVPRHFPRWPDQRPTVTAEQVELGRWLFYDRRLSIDGSRSCGICHDQARGFADGLSRGVGIDNALLNLNSPSVFNIAWRTELTWFKQLSSVESHMMGPLFTNHPVEMGLTEDLLHARLNDFERYSSLFKEAFPADVEPITTKNTITAISAFTRSIISSNSRYDHYLEGSLSLTSQEEQGMALFFSDRLRCSFCHGGVFFDEPSTVVGASQRHGYFNTGLYNIGGEGAYPDNAQGLIELTGNTIDMGVFRVPTLRNLESTYPWMHDGSEIDLRNIIRNYAAGGRVIQTGFNAGDGRLNPHKSDSIQGFDITEDEIDAVLAFLDALNDEVLLTDERYASPFCIEQRGEVINSPCEPHFR